jgi:hypothetical protein
VLPQLSRPSIELERTEASGRNEVDCDLGDTIAEGLGKPRPGQTLSIRGVCAENVEISEAYNEITLDGGDTGVINAITPSVDTLRIYADQVTVRGLTISGGRDGVNLRGAAGATIVDNVITCSGMHLPRRERLDHLDQRKRLEGILSVMSPLEAAVYLGVPNLLIVNEYPRPGQEPTHKPFEPPSTSGRCWASATASVGSSFRPWWRTLAAARTPSSSAATSTARASQSASPTRVWPTRDIGHTWKVSIRSRAGPRSQPPG